MKKQEGFKQLNIRAPIALYEAFHRIFSVKGEKQAFFLKMMALAVDKGSKWSMTKQIIEEIEERYGR